MLKKIFFNTLIALCIATIVSSINIYFPSFVQSFDSKIKDYMFLIRGEIKNDNNIIIIDIDEKSLQELGQFPWSRNILSQILLNLTNAGIGVIGFDIVFAEEDRSSPKRVLQNLNLDTTNVPNYDDEFNQVVSRTPTILGYQFELENKAFIKKEEINIPAIVIEKNKNSGQEMLISAQGTILNHKTLQQSAYSSGFFNNLPDEGGTIRSVPLIIQYDGQLYPSLSLEIIRALIGVDTVLVNYTPLGVENIQIGSFKIPTDRHGRMIVNYRGGSKNFQYLSAIDIFNNRFNPKNIEGKIALIGTSATGLNDLRATPFGSVFPGVEVHANVIDNIITQDFLTIPSWIDGANTFIIYTTAIITMLLMIFATLWFIPFVFFILLGATFYITYEAMFFYGILMNTFLPLLTISITTLVAIFINNILNIKTQKMIKSKFASKVSKEVMENLLINPSSSDFSAMEKEVTIFFSDIRNFTNISETMPNAKVLIEFLNQYMTPMSKIVMGHQGTIDKFIGDAIMAYWNAPYDVTNHAQKAVDASLEQLYLLKKLNQEIKENTRFKTTVEQFAQKGLEPLDIGIGINTGLVIVGEMGSEQRSDYTVIGDSVNISSRIESLCKFYGSQLNITKETKEQLPDKYLFRFLDYITVKGKNKPIELWQIHDYDDKNKKDTLYKINYDKIKEELVCYHKAIDFYKNKEFQKALDIFQNIEKQDEKTNQKIYNIYIKRCLEFIENPDNDFDEVFNHTEK
jgi:adenylate cyclase